MMSIFKDAFGKKAFFRILLILAISAALFLLLIMPLRGIMNAVSRIDFISQRLDDYPHMYDNYRQETKEWWEWWLKEDYGTRARQAALIYDTEKNVTGHEELLNYITQTVGADKAEVMTQEAYQRKTEQNQSEEESVSAASLEDGKMLVLSFHDGMKEERMSYVEDEENFLSQLQAGLPGYVCILREDNLSIYPKDKNEDYLKNTIRHLLDNGQLKPEADKAAAKAALTADSRHSTKSRYVLNGDYVFYSAAYAENDDFAISVTELSTLFRFGRKRSWSLWYLACAVLILMCVCLWKTQLYHPVPNLKDKYRNALRTGMSAVFIASLLMLASVTVVQMLSGTNLSQQGATDQAEYLKNVLKRESDRAESITDAFDSMHLARAQTAASVLSRNPQMINIDSLYRLDEALGGSGLMVFNQEGMLVMSDDPLQQVAGESNGGSAFQINLSDMILMAEDSKNIPDEKEYRCYRAVMHDANGKTNGWVELSVSQKQLDTLLHETSLSEVIGDLHLMDTLHVVVVDKGDKAKIVASTWKKWVGEMAEDHDIHSQLVFDGYEGIVSFDGNKCYSVVFEYGDNHVIVGSEEASALVFIGGVFILTFLLVLILVFCGYIPLTRVITTYQEREMASGYLPENPRRNYPPLWEYIQDFMISVFLLSSILFIMTNGDPTGLTYNIVRGRWARGINAATITTCIMLFSVVFAGERLLNIIIQRLGKYLSPKGVTICRLVDSCFAYLGAIVMILYALAMFGVNATTLVGGVGVMAVIFTLGANSLIADVLAGLFIIFEGDFIVGDVVVINDFRGVVTDVSIRTTKLMDDNSQDIKIISNSSIKELINQSRQVSTIMLDIPIGKSLGLEKGVPLLKEKLKVLPAIFPKIIGEVEYWGVCDFPSRNQMTGKYGGCKVRIAMYCLEKDREMLTYAVKEELMRTMFYRLTEKPADSETPENSGDDKRKISKPLDLKNS